MRKSVLYVSLCALLAIRVFPVVGFDRQDVFEHIKAIDGFTQNSVTDILQDSQGYIWIGSPNGLFKYDGYQFEKFLNDPEDSFSLIQNEVYALFQDSDGFIWIGTDDGLNRYDPVSTRFCRYKLIDKSRGRRIRVNVINQTSDDRIWVGTNRGLFLSQDLSNSSKDSITFISINEPFENVTKYGTANINDIEIVNENEVLVASNTGVDRLKIQGNKVLTHNMQIESNANIISISSNGNWVGAGDGLYIRSTDDSTQYLPTSIDLAVRDVFVGRDGQIWVSTDFDGLIQYDSRTDKWRSYTNNQNLEKSLRSDQVSLVREDHSGVLWIGTVRGGLSRLLLEKKQIEHLKRLPNDKNSLPDNMLNGIYEDSENNVWVTTFNRGLSKISLVDGKYQFVNYNKKTPQFALPVNNIFSFIQDDLGNYWIGTHRKGLCFAKHLGNGKYKVKEYDISTKNGGLPFNNISLLFKSRDGDIWAGSFKGDGLFRFTPDENGIDFNKLTRYLDREGPNAMVGTQIASICESKSGDFWIGTSGNGLSRLTFNGKKEITQIIQYRKDSEDLKGLSSDNVFSLFEDESGNLWIGTFGGGLNKLEDAASTSNKELKKYRIKDGLPSDVVYGILPDEHGKLWLSTDDGISVFDPVSEKFRNYHVEEGLQESNYRKFSYHKGASGRMYFGGINGLNVFYPDSIKDNPHKPRTVITDFKIFNKTVNVGDEILGHQLLNKSISATEQIILHHYHNSFSFEFSSLHYASPNRNKYAYMLENFNKDWQFTDAERRYAAYSNLSAGDYIFRVKSSNNDGIWADDEARILIKVLPPPWKTWWAYCLYVIVILAILYVFRRNVLKNQEFENKLKNQRFEQEKIEEVNQMKLRFFTNISHEFKTPLTLIIGPLEKLLVSGNIKKENKSLLLMMQRNANQLFRLINQVMEFRRIETNELKLNPVNGELVSFSYDIVDSFQVLANENKIQLSFAAQEQDLELWLDWDSIEKILNNLISNALKNTPEGGLVDVSIGLPDEKNLLHQGTSMESECIQIIVKDNGSGIPEDELEFIFERFYQVENASTESSGSGVGLALTKELVKLNHGEIDVSSQQGLGTEFIVKLPIGKKHLVEGVEEISGSSLNYETLIHEKIGNQVSEESEEDMLEHDGEEYDSKKPIILIVEDNNDMLTFIRGVLEPTYEVIEAENGKEGMDLALKEMPDLIVSDVMMPVMDGIEFCKQCKANEVTNHIPFILLTARASIEHRIEGLDTGADSYIPKPFHNKHLQVRVRKLLEQMGNLKSKFGDSGLKLGSKDLSLNDSNKAFLEHAEQIIEENLTNSDFAVEDLCDEMGFSRMQLYRKLKSVYGESANKFVRAYRLKKAAYYLINTEYNITEILYRVGFTNSSYFTKCFKRQFGQSPKEYAKAHRVES